MSTYSQIQGISIQSVSSDPPNPSDGQLWYNSTTAIFKINDFLQNGSWSTGGNLGTGRYNLRGLGTQTAGLAAGGFSPAGAPPSDLLYLNISEEYNGTSWTGGGTMNTRRGTFGTAGLQTSGLVFGGSNWPVGNSGTDATEEYDGSSWTAGGNLGTARYSLSGAGTQTAGLAFGGYPGISSTEEYDGSTWTAGGNMISGTNQLSGTGIQTAGLAIGGGGTRVNTEEYDGSSWTAGGNLNTGREFTQAFGTQTDTLTAGGNTPSTVFTSEKYDGTSWTSSANMNEFRQNGASGGASASAGGFVAGAGTPGVLGTSTEEYDGPSNLVKTISVT